MHSLKINRTIKGTKQTLGELFVLKDGATIYNCKTLELPWLENKNKVSCIPVGTYKVVKRQSPKYGEHFHITNVPKRDYILIHAANHVRQLLGCVAVGKTHTDIDGDGLRDVTSSKVVMGELLKLLPSEFNLTIA